MLQGGGPSIDDNDILDALDLKRKRCVRKWTPEEDQEMIDMVLKHGTKMWGLIGSKLKDRTGKQCRERWHNQLDPAIKKDPWTRAEEEVLMRSHSVHGNKWAEIAKMLPGRTDNAIKNHWNSAKRRLSRQLNMTVSTAERRSWSYDEDDPSKAPQGGSGPGGGNSRYTAHADITVDTGASYPASDDDDEADNDADDGSEDRTSSPTSVADFSSADGGTSNIFSAKEDGGGRGGGRSEQQAGVLSLKTQGHSAAGCSSTSGSGGEAGRPLYRTGGGCGQAGSEQTPAATPGGSGGGGGVGHEGDARTTSELMSAQALFRGSIPGLTSFDRVEINNFHREKAMLLSAAKAAGDTKKRIMIEETTPDVLNAKGLLMFLKQSPSVVPDPAATSTRTRRIAGAVDSDGRSPAAGVGTTVNRGDAASADTGVSDVGPPIETAALQALKMPPPLPLAGAAEAHVAEASAPAPAGVAASSKSKASPLLAAAAAMDRGRPVSATAAAAARSAAAAAAVKAARFKTCLRGGRAPCDATVAARRDLPRRVSAAAAELLRAPSSKAEPTPRGGCDGSSLPGRTPSISPARSLSPVKIALPATRCGIRKPTGGPVPVTPGTPAASPASTTKAHLAAPSARMPVYRMPVVPSHPLTPRTSAAAHPPSTPVGRAGAASPAKIPASTPSSSKASYVSRASHSRPALPPPARAIPVTPGTPCFARGPVELFASPLPGPLARGDAEDATAAATAMARLAASAAPTERRGGGNVMGKRKESGEAVVAKRGRVLGKRPKVTAI